MVQQDIFSKIKAFEHSYSARVGLFVEDPLSGKIISHNGEEVFETSSTIKVPIMKNVLSGIDDTDLDQLLTTEVPIADRDSYPGSGVVYWTDWEKLSIAQHMYMVARYSDCVCTNVLIRYLGGRDVLNNLLLQEGYNKTSLTMYPLDFADEHGPMPRVGQTSPHEMTNIFYEAFIATNKRGMAFKTFTSSLFESWLDLAFEKIGTKAALWHKTGSMLDHAEKGHTVCNAVGVAKYGNQYLNFAIYSEGMLPRVKNREHAVDIYKLELSKILDMAFRYLA